ncbi:MAG: hypothetical protein AB7U30_10900 [Sulfuricellaceae bacterium]
MSNLFGAMASAETGDFDTVQQFLKQREVEREMAVSGGCKQGQGWPSEAADEIKVDHS